MVTTELGFIQRNSIESARLAALMQEFERCGGKVEQVDTYKPGLPPLRRDWIEPDTVLKRKAPVMSRRDRNALKAMAEALR